MNHSELHKIVERLSYKYKNAQMREDLYQEGYMACLEVLGSKPNAHPAELHRAADKAMWDYMNLTNLPVSVPKSNASRDALKGGRLDASQSYSEEGAEALLEAVGSVSVEYEDNIMQVPDCSEEYERYERDALVATKLVTTLKGIPLEVIKLRYYQDLTQEEVGVQLGMSKQAVSKHETQALMQLKCKLKQFVN